MSEPRSPENREGRGQLPFHRQEAEAQESGLPDQRSLGILDPKLVFTRNLGAGDSLGTWVEMAEKLSIKDGGQWGQQAGFRVGQGLQTEAHGPGTWGLTQAISQTQLVRTLAVLT